MISANISKERRREVYRRDGYACALCSDPRHLQIHHYIPRSEGGSDSEMNLITLCHVCHAMAHNIKLIDTDLTKDDIDQAICEYLADWYAPYWKP